MDKNPGSLDTELKLIKTEESKQEYREKMSYIPALDTALNLSRPKNPNKKKGKR